MKKRAHKVSNGSRHHNQQAARSLEDGILEFSRSGELAVVARRAIKKQRDEGLPVTFRRGKNIIKQYPDGREEVLEEIEQSHYSLRDDVEIIGKV